MKKCSCFGAVADGIRDGIVSGGKVCLRRIFSGHTCRPVESRGRSQGNAGIRAG